MYIDMAPPMAAVIVWRMGNAIFCMALFFPSLRHGSYFVIYAGSSHWGGPRGVGCAGVSQRSCSGSGAGGIVPTDDDGRG